MVKAPVICRLEPRAQASHAALTPFLAQRVRAYAAAHQPEAHPDEYASQVLAGLWGGAPGVAAYVAVDPTTGALLGHALATAESLGTARWVGLVQTPAKGLGDVRFALIDQVLAWAASLGSPRVVLQAPGRDKALETRYGAKLVRHILELPLVARDAPALAAV